MQGKDDGKNGFNLITERIKEIFIMHMHQYVLGKRCI